MDKYVGEQFNNQLPKLSKRKKTDITVTSIYPSDDNSISTTTQKTSKVVPLIVYWQYDYRHTCALNPSIAVTDFTNDVNTLSSKQLAQKLNGQHLELKVEQIPSAFAIVDKGHLVWVIYPISWDRIYVEPDFKDLVVSYKLMQNDAVVKTGKITIKSNAQNKGIHFFQSWKSATSDYLADYNANLSAMSKDFVSKLVEEL